MTTTSASLREFVRRLSTKESSDIEKLLVHLLDSSMVYWNKKATTVLDEAKRPSLHGDRYKVLRKEYEVAFNNVQRIMRMRHGVGISKRVL